MRMECVCMFTYFLTGYQSIHGGLCPRLVVVTCSPQAARVEPNVCVCVYSTKNNVVNTALLHLLRLHNCKKKTRQRRNMHGMVQ